MRSMVRQNGRITKLSIKNMLKRTTIPIRYFHRMFVLGLDGRRHRRNLNTLVIGGSGAGKTRFFGKPNLMQCNTSFVILDPKGEQLRDVGNLLEKEGYVIKVVDLINMNRSHCYNPFRYIKDDKDVLKLITNLIRNTTPKGSQTNDPFWGATRSIVKSYGMRTC